MNFLSNPPRSRSAALGALIVCACAIAACGDARSDARAGAQGRAQTSNGTIALPAEPYRVVAVASGATLTGRVLLEGEVPTPAAWRPRGDSAVCGAEVHPPAAATEANGPVARAVVWLADVRAGRALPVERRIVAEPRRCAIEPRVLAVVTGTTLNLRNVDPVGHHLVAVHERGDTLGVTRFTGDHQVVPADRLAGTPGLVHLRSRHYPGMRAWVLVFDHPYFAVTADDGTFTLEGVPTGTHRVMVWHEGAERAVERTVTIAAGGSAELEVGLRLR